MVTTNDLIGHTFTEVFSKGTKITLTFHLFDKLMYLMGSVFLALFFYIFSAIWNGENGNSIITLTSLSIVALGRSI